jgi:hypothetical protein
VQHIGAGDRDDGVGDLLVVGDRLDDKAELVARDLADRLALGHHAVMAVAADHQPVAVRGRTEIGGLLLDIPPHRCEERIEPGDQQRVAGAADRDRPVAGALDTFELNRVGVGGLPAQAADLDGAVGDRLEIARLGVEHAARLDVVDRARILVQGMIGDRERGAAPLRVQRLAFDMVVAHRDQ